MKNISLQRECDADKTDIFFIDIKTNLPKYLAKILGIISKNIKIL